MRPLIRDSCPEGDISVEESRILEKESIGDPGPYKQAGQDDLSGVAKGMLASEIVPVIFFFWAWLLRGHLDPLQRCALCAGSFMNYWERIKYVVIKRWVIANEVKQSNQISASSRASRGSSQ